MRSMQIALALAALLCMSFSATAAPELSLSSLTTYIGGSGVIELRLTGADDTYFGFNAKVVLPPGVQLTGVERGGLVGADFNLVTHTPPETPNVHLFAVYSTSAGINADGVLLNLAIQITDDPAEIGLDPGETIQVETRILNSALAGEGGGTSVAHGTQNGSLLLSMEPMPLLSVLPASQNVAATSGQTQFNVVNDGNADMPWTATLIDGGDWISISEGQSGVNNGTVVLNYVQTLAPLARTARVLVDAGQAPGSPVTVTITQAGDLTPVLSVNPLEVAVPSASGISDIAVANEGNGEMPWTARVVSGLEWLSISGGASGVNDGIVTVACLTNVTDHPRTGVVQISAPGVAGSPVSVTVHQAAPAVLAVTPHEQAIAQSGGQAEFDVSNIGNELMNWTAAVMSGGDWLTLTGGDAGTDAGVVSASCEVNTTGIARTAQIQVSAPGAAGGPVMLTVKQAGTQSLLLSVFPEEQTVKAAAETAEISVRNVGSGVMSWTAAVVEGADWATIESGASGTQDGVIRVGFDKNTWMEDREAVIRVTADGADGSPAEARIIQRSRELITVTLPNGGENLHRGETVQIQWTTVEKAVDAVTINLTRGGSFHSTISVTADNSGGYAWTVPADIEPGDDYAIQVYNVADSALHDESDGPFAIACPPDAPQNVGATEGQPGKVTVTWAAVDAATQYEVYRANEDDSSAAQLIGTATATMFDDTTAEPPHHSLFGCQGDTVYTYFYFVKAGNECSASAFSDSAEGSAGDMPCDLIFEKAFPSESVEGRFQITKPDEALYVRMRSDAVIDMDSISGLVTRNGVPSGGVQWLAIDETDGWAVYEPATPWQPGELVEVAVQGMTTAATAVGPVTQKFEVAAEFVPADDVKPIWQPAYDEESGEIVTTKETPTQEAWITADDADASEPPTYIVGPERAYETPQRVWIPLPAGLTAETAVLWYYCASDETPGWYPAGQLQGLLADENYLAIQINGADYLGILVNHGGKIQLRAPETAQAVAASAIPTGIDIVIPLLAVMLILLATSAKRKPRIHASER